MIRAGSIIALGLVACSTESADAPHVNTVISNIDGIIGANCAGAAPALMAPDGSVHPLQSIIRFYYLNLHGARTKIDGQSVLQLSLSPGITQAGEEYVEWQGKSGNIFGAPGALTHSHGKYFPGDFGFLSDAEAPEEGCSGEVLDDQARRDGTLAHLALSQAGECGHNDDGSIKFWQVNGLALLPIGATLEVQQLIDAGLAVAVASAPADRCIIPDLAGEPGELPPPTPGAMPDIPCQIAYHPAAVTEGVVLPVPSSAVVEGTPLEMRPFTAAGVDPLPNDLDEVRTVVRSTQLRAMFAIGLPTITWLGGTKVQITGHRIGPAATPSSVLLPDERAWVDGVAGTYESTCCHEECSVSAPVTTGQIPGLAPLAAAAAVVGGGGGGGGGGVTCTKVCIAEGKCSSGTATGGLIVMDTFLTGKECNGDCPATYVGAPVEQPMCQL